MGKTEITILINDLIKLGEDRDELSYWLQIFDDLDQEQQTILCQNLAQELEELKSV